LARVFSPNLTSRRPTPCSEIRSPPHFSLASWALIRLGRTPGEQRERHDPLLEVRPIWLGIRGAGARAH
jgi:hypothetical protein